MIWFNVVVVLPKLALGRSCSGLRPVLDLLCLGAGEPRGGADNRETIAAVGGVLPD